MAIVVSYEHVIRIWNMDNKEILAAIDTDRVVRTWLEIWINCIWTVLDIFVYHNKIKIFGNEVDLTATSHKILFGGFSKIIFRILRKHGLKPHSYYHLESWWWKYYNRIKYKYSGAIWAKQRHYSQKETIKLKKTQLYFHKKKNVILISRLIVFLNFFFRL